MVRDDLDLSFSLTMDVKIGLQGAQDALGELEVICRRVLRHEGLTVLLGRIKEVLDDFDYSYVLEKNEQLGIFLSYLHEIIFGLESLINCVILCDNVSTIIEDLEAKTDDIAKISQSEAIQELSDSFLQTKEDFIFSVFGLIGFFKNRNSNTFESIEAFQISSSARECLDLGEILFSLVNGSVERKKIQSKKSLKDINFENISTENIVVENGELLFASAPELVWLITSPGKIL